MRSFLKSGSESFLPFLFIFFERGRGRRGRGGGGVLEGWRSGWDGTHCVALTLLKDQKKRKQRHIETFIIFCKRTSISFSPQFRSCTFMSVWVRFPTHLTEFINITVVYYRSRAQIPNVLLNIITKTSSQPISSTPQKAVRYLLANPCISCTTNFTPIHKASSNSI